MFFFLKPKSVFLKLFFVVFLVSTLFAPFSFQSSDLSPTVNVASAQSSIENLECGWGEGTASFENCFVKSIYLIIYVPVAYFLSFTGYVFDAVVGFSISSKVAGGGALVEDGWNMIRNITNGVFLIVVIYLALSLVLGIGATDAKRTLTVLIIIALLINFSLFFSRLVIDASNVAAYTFYSHLGVPKEDDNSEPHPILKESETGIKERTISVNIVNAIKPQNLIGEDMYEDFTKPGDTQSSALIFLLLLATVVAFIVATLLLTGAVIFLARVVILWFLMILAPLAFVAFILPKTKQYGEQWFQTLLSQAFIAPIYLFMLYIVIYFITNQQVQTFFKEENGDWLRDLVAILIIGIFYIIALGAISTVTQRAGGKAGQLGVQYGKMARSRALSATKSAGGAGLRSTANRGGKLAESLRGSRFMQNRVEKGGFIARNIESGLNRGASGYNKALDRKTKARIAQGKRLDDPDAQEEYERRMRNEKAVGFGRSAVAKRLASDIKGTQERMNAQTDTQSKAEVFMEADEAQRKQLYRNMKNPKERLEMAEGAHQLSQTYLSEARDLLTSGNEADRAEGIRLKNEAKKINAEFGSVVLTRDGGGKIDSKRSQIKLGSLEEGLISAKVGSNKNGQSASATKKREVVAREKNYRTGQNTKKAIDDINKHMDERNKENQKNNPATPEES